MDVQGGSGQVRLIGALLAIGVLLAACGGADNGGGNGGGASAGGGGGGGGGGGDLPLGSSVLFGSAFDPGSLAVTGKATSLKQGTPMVAVGRALAAQNPADVTVTIAAPGQNPPPQPITAANGTDSADLFAIDLAPFHLKPGTFIINFLDANKRVLASGFLSITP
jgi:hypothetical protein